MVGPHVAEIPPSIFVDRLTFDKEIRWTFKSFMQDGCQLGSLPRISGRQESNRAAGVNPFRINSNNRWLMNPR